MLSLLSSDIWWNGGFSEEKALFKSHMSNSNTKCNVLYIFTFCSILTKRSSEKYTTDIKFIYYANRTYLFGSILVYGSLLCLSSAHVHETGNKQREKLVLLQI